MKQNINNNSQNNLDPRTQLFAFATFVLGIIVFALKYCGYLKTGSIALYSDAIESIINIMVAVFTLLAIYISRMPADTNHHFGHNKAEYFSAAIEGILIIIASVVILYQIWKNFYHPQRLFELNKGVIYNIFAAILQGGCGIIIFLGSRRFKSIALRADAVHLLTDFITTSWVMVGLICAYYSQIYYIDSIIAVLVTLNIFWQGYKLLNKSVEGLMDHAVDQTTYNKISEIIAYNGNGAIEVHDLRTRVAGYLIFIEFHLVVESNMTILQAHKICDRIEDELQNQFVNSRITIHLEPQEEAKFKSGTTPIPVINNN